MIFRPSYTPEMAIKPNPNSFALELSHFERKFFTAHTHIECNSGACLTNAEEVVCRENNPWRGRVSKECFDLTALLHLP